MYQTVARSRAPARIVHIDTEQLGAASEGAPSGVVFHVGRCGSTVLSQALKQLDDVAVYSEPLPVNELLSPATGTRSEVVSALRHLGGAFAAHAGRPYVFKLSSWNTLFCDVIAEAFPSTPWVFCVRDPVEVGETILRDPPPWFGGASEAAQHISRIVDPQGLSASAEESFARLYAAFCAGVLSLRAERGALVRYERLTAALAGVPAHFGFQMDERAATRMRESASQYAKAPIARPVPFVSDTAAKQAGASANLRSAIDLYARAPLDLLFNTLKEV